MSATNASTGLTGYTCSQCGGWVQYGITHICPTLGAGQYHSTPPTPTDGALHRIASAFERIAAALENLTEKSG